MGDGGNHLVRVFTEIIVYNHQPDANTFVCKAGIEPAELREKYIKLLLCDFLKNSPSGARTRGLGVPWNQCEWGG